MTAKNKRFSYYYESAWMMPKEILQAKFQNIREFAKFNIFEEEFPERSDKSFQLVDGTAVIQVYGDLVETEDGYEEMFGECSMPKLRRNILKAHAKGLDLILAIDTPGGTVKGAFETADLLEKVSQDIETTTICVGNMTSAGMLLASSTKRRYISGKTNQVGSIGVYMQKQDWTKWNEERGIDVQEFVSGKYKNVGSQDRKTDDFEKEEIQARCDYLFSLFADDVSRRMNIPVEQIVEMEAKIFIGQQAIEAGLVDGVMTLEDLLETEIKETKTMSKQNEEKAKSAEDVVQPSLNADEIIKKERTRVLDIQASAFPGQEDLVKKAIDEGLSAGDAALLFNKSEKAKAKQHLDEMVKDSPKPVASSEPVVEKKEEKKFATLKDEYEGTPSLQAEFGDFERYESFVNAEQGGLVKIHSK